MKILILFPILIGFLAVNLFAVDENNIELKKEAGDNPPGIYTPGKSAIPDVLKASPVDIAVPMPEGFIKRQEPETAHEMLFPGNTFLNDTLQEINVSETIFSSKFAAFEIDTENEKLTFISSQEELPAVCKQAIDEAPNWMEKDLTIQMHRLSDREIYAQMILDAEQKIKDEVAFQTAYMSEESLKHSRFVKDRDLLVKNAELIYEYADSLKYVRLKERGNFESGDYYTTTEYRIKDGQNGEIIWSEIPCEYYYRYVVSPKVHQEGVYSSDASDQNQRTYDFFWREYIWQNPAGDYDYKQVNKTTSEGSIDTIRRFGELAQIPEVLWDRTPKYLEFGREYNNNQTALDMFGNWASRAIPVDAQLPRAVQPNQALYEHNGNCGEDAYLVAGMLRTALIPNIYLLSSGEDHAFGSIWDDGWHHYEFFRGGLSEQGNDFYGITNMLPRGSYGWTTSVVNGTQIDGGLISFTDQYIEPDKKTAALLLHLADSEGNPVDGARLTVYCYPNPYGNMAISGHAWSDRNGDVKIEVGPGVRYLGQLYHKDLGYLPHKDSLFYITGNSNAGSGRKYEGTVNFKPNSNLDPLPVNEITGLPRESDIGININFTSHELIVAQNHTDVQRSVFRRWKQESAGAVNYFLCDEDNFNKFKSGDSFDAYYSHKNISDGSNLYAIPRDGKWYLILSNKYATSNYQHIEAECLLMKGEITDVEELSSEDSNITVYPNPFNSRCHFRSDGNIDRMEIYDTFGNKIETLDEMPYIWPPDSNNPAGLYIIKAYSGGSVRTAKIIFNK